MVVKPLIVVGAGGHAKVLISTLGLLDMKIEGICENNAELVGKNFAGYQLMSENEVFSRYSPASVYLVNAVGSVGVTKNRSDVFERFKAHGYLFQTIVHPKAVLASTVCLGEGAQIMAGAILQDEVAIGVNSIVNTGAIVDHDCEIGNHCHIAPGATLSGGVRVSNSSHIGTGAVVMQKIRIAEGVVIGAGAVVNRDTDPRSCYVGVPAKYLKSV